MFKRGRKRNKNRRNWKWQRLLFIFLFLIFILIILFRLGEIQEIVGLLKQVNYMWLVLAFISHLTVFAALAGLYKSILGKASFLHLFKTAITMVFVDHAIPSFSASGNVLLYYATRKRNIKREKAAFLIAMNIFLNFLFFFIIFVSGLVYLFISKRMFNINILVMMCFIILILFILVSRILWTKTGEINFKNFLSWITKKFPRARKRTLAVVSDFYRAKKTFRHSRFILFLFFIFLSYLFKILGIFFVFLSLGYLINPGILIVGYVIVSIVSMVSYIRIGIYEASMAFGYSMLGIPYNIALTTALVYRGVAFWIPFFLGFIFFRTLVRENKKYKKKKK